MKIIGVAVPAHHRHHSEHHYYSLFSIGMRFDSFNGNTLLLFHSLVASLSLSLFFFSSDIHSPCLSCSHSSITLTFLHLRPIIYFAYNEAQYYKCTCLLYRYFLRCSIIHLQVFQAWHIHTYERVRVCEIIILIFMQ